MDFDGTPIGRRSSYEPGRPPNGPQDLPTNPTVLQHLMAILSQDPRVAQQAMTGLSSALGLVNQDPSAMKNMGSQTIMKVGGVYGQSPYVDEYNQAVQPSMIHQLLQRFRGNSGQ
jgi:hypothetical protein